MSEEFVNKVAESGIITLDLEKYFPDAEIVLFDIKDYLFMGLILKEKDFRQALKDLDVQKYQQKIDRNCYYPDRKANLHEENR